MTATRRNFISAIFGATAVAVVGRQESVAPTSFTPTAMPVAWEESSLGRALGSSIIVELIGANLGGMDPVLQVVISSGDLLRTFRVDVETWQRRISDGCFVGRSGIRSFMIKVTFEGAIIHLESTLILKQDPRIELVANTGVVLASSREWA